MVLSKVKGVKTKPTAVRAVLPTSRSPMGVNLILPPGAVVGAPFGRKNDALPTKSRSRERDKKYKDTPGTFLRSNSVSYAGLAPSSGSAHRYKVGTVPRQSPRTPSARTTSFVVLQILARAICARVA